jgi:hypothetical protein
LQAEVSDYKARITKLEEEVSSLKKHKVEKPINEIVSTIPVGTGQPRKRGRPSRKSSTSINALHESQVAHGQKPAPSKSLFEIKSPIIKSFVLEKGRWYEQNVSKEQQCGTVGSTEDENEEETGDEEGTSSSE